jgi:hypothetical protein
MIIKKEKMKEDNNINNESPENNKNLKTEPKMEYCRNLSFEIKNIIKKTSCESLPSNVSNNYNYNFNYGYDLPSLLKSENKIKTNSPLKRYLKDINEIESNYATVKKEFRELKP